MKKTLAIVLALVIVVGSIALFAGCGKKAEDATTAPAGETPTAESDLAYVKEKGKLVVGVTDFAPMDYEDDNGEWIGFDADMAKAFAESLGVDVEIIEIEWDNKVLELNNKTIDCVWNGMTIDDEVKAAMDVSVAYCNNAQTVIVNKDIADTIKGVEDCKELNFAVEAGSAGEKQAKANEFNFTPVKDQATALLEIKAGTANAAIIDSLMAAAMVGEGTAYEDLTYTISLTSEEYGVGFRQGSDLVAAINDFFKAATADGSMAKVAETYGVQAALIDIK